MLNCWVTRDEGHLVLLERLDQLGEVHQRAAEPVDLVDDDDVDQPGLDVAQQALQRRPLQRAARDAAIVVLVRQRDPALGALALDVGQPRLALGVEGVELLLQPLLGGLAGVDRAAELAGRRGAHALPLRRPKNSGPFQRVPVIARATADRLA